MGLAGVVSSLSVLLGRLWENVQHIFLVSKSSRYVGRNRKMMRRGMGRGKTRDDDKERAGEGNEDDVCVVNEGRNEDEGE